MSLSPLILRKIRYLSCNQQGGVNIDYIQLGRLPLQWRHNGRGGVSNHQPHDCLLSRLFRRGSKKTSKLRFTGICEGNSLVTSEFLAQMASNAENVSIWWCHHDARADLWLSDDSRNKIVFMWSLTRVTKRMAAEWEKQTLTIRKLLLWCDRCNLWVLHDDVIKWKHFPRFWPFARGIHRSQRPMTRIFGVFFDVRLSKRLNKQWVCRGYESRVSLWHHCNAHMLHTRP